jgi:hypothetical protein
MDAITSATTTMGTPSADEIRDWAHDHHLPYHDSQVHVPDVRIAYFDVEGHAAHEDLEVVTLHYRGAHRAAVGRSGFTAVRGSTARCGGSPFDPDLAEELL